MYAKDISKKVKSSKKIAAQQGKFLGSITPYGYTRSKEERCKLEIDKISSMTVKRIFYLYSIGTSARGIAEILNEEKILNPLSYYYKSTGIEPKRKISKSWTTSTITSILRNQVYLGFMVQGKDAMKSFKTNKRIKIPEGDWIIVKNTHDAIIKLDLWEDVQNRLKDSNIKRGVNSKNKDSNPFEDILFCMDCGSRMTFNTRVFVSKTTYIYRCSKYLQQGKSVCSSHRINLDILKEAVLHDIRTNAKIAKFDEQKFIMRFQEENNALVKNSVYEYEKIKNDFEKRIVLIDDYIQKAFEKNCDGVISDEAFKRMSKKFDIERADLLSKIDEYKKIIESMKTNDKKIKSEVNKLLKYSEINSLTKKVVYSLIEKIFVSEAKIIDGEKTFDIEINYKFQLNCNGKKDLDNKKDITSANIMSNG